MAERILVEFGGEGSGVGELTWRQQHSWEAPKLTITDVPDAVGLTVSADTRCVPPAATEELVRSTDALVVGLSLDPATSWPS
jgi:hypothetical protein